MAFLFLNAGTFPYPKKRYGILLARSSDIWRNLQVSVKRYTPFFHVPVFGFDCASDVTTVSHVSLSDERTSSGIAAESAISCPFNSDVRTFYRTLSRAYSPSSMNIYVIGYKFRIPGSISRCKIICTNSRIYEGPT